MDYHRELMTLIVGYTSVGVFVATALVTVLSLVEILKVDQHAKKRLYSILILEIVAISVANYRDVISFSPKPLETKIETLVATNERLGQTTPALSASGSSSSLKPRIYFHIRNEAQRALAQNLADQITAHGDLVVPGIQKLNVGPTSTELRYFKTSEEQEAIELGKALRNAGLQVTVKYVPGFEKSTSIRPRHYELWIAS